VWLSELRVFYKAVFDGYLFIPYLAVQQNVKHNINNEIFGL
jgi:hypothetical protein